MGSEIQVHVHWKLYMYMHVLNQVHVHVVAGKDLVSTHTSCDFTIFGKLATRCSLIQEKHQCIILSAASTMYLWDNHNKAHTTACRPGICYPLCSLLIFPLLLKVSLIILAIIPIQWGCTFFFASHTCK